MRLGRGRKPFFFEKKKQKTFIILGRNWLNGHDLNYKSFFCFFFVHKKEDSSPFLNQKFNLK